VIDPKKVCWDVLDPDFDAKNQNIGIDKNNKPISYDSNYDYVGSDWIYKHFGVGLKRYFCGADINRAAFLHDIRYELGTGFGDFDFANDQLRNDIVKLISAAGHPYWARVIGWMHFFGVQSIPAWIDYKTFRKKQ